MNGITLRAALGATLLLAALATDGAAQIRASEMASVSQMVDGTTLTLTYSRPAARGREIFGNVVPWDVIWTPGANWATTLSADKDIRVAGTPVPAGKYSVWMTPRHEGPWTLTLDPRPGLFHFQKPDSTDEQIHIAVEPERADHQETLTWSFPAFSGDAALLAMRWTWAEVPMEIVVPPSRPAEVAAEDRALYVGSYDLRVMDGIGYPTRGEFRVTERDGRLRGSLPFPLHPGDELEFDLVPAGVHRFNPGLYHGDQLFNVEMGLSFEFEVGDGAASVIMRGIEGTAFGQGARSTHAHPPQGGGG